MVLTIMRDGDKIVVGSRDRRFTQAWGGGVTLGTTVWFTNLEEIASWVNNTLKEDCLFELV